ncbi:hypothetical protein NIES2111_56180 (plasmid) [Nostoc sp. NIES-2111]|nr:hypothetical protein NIES2111_56180 [Nostoc sp. NIES-2111]
MTLLGVEKLDKPADTTTPQLKVWDERDLLTSDRRREKLEILLCQKVQTGEDTALCEKVLDYLYLSAFQQKLTRITVQKEKERSVFAFIQQVVILSFTILGMFAFLAAAANKSVVHSPIVNPPAIERQAP